MKQNSLEDAIERLKTVSNANFKEALEKSEQITIEQFVVAPYSVPEYERIAYVNKFLDSTLSAMDFAKASNYKDFDVYYLVRLGDGFALVWLSTVFP